MLLAAPRDVWRRRSVILLMIGYLALTGCNSQGAHHKPLVQIDLVPPANEGGPEQMERIGGRVSGAQPGQQIVLYAQGGGSWWIQPFRREPFTKIQPDSSWENTTHLGTEYAALLVEPSYNPASRLEGLPTEGNGVIAVVTAKGKPAAPIASKVIHFSGYDWTARSVGSDRGGVPNSYDPANAWTDPKGYLHLHMGVRDGRWTCAEVGLTRSLGFGSYRFVVEDSGHLEPSAVLEMYTWDDSEEEAHRELDVELSRWGDPDSKNAQYVVQPYYVPENILRFEAPPGVVSHMFRWAPGTASFTTTRGSAAESRTKSVSEHVFTSGIPTPGAEKIHIDLYDFHHSKTELQRPAEVVIEKFEYLP